MSEMYRIPNYDAKNLDYRVPSEEHAVEEITDSIINPKMGSFFASSMRLVNLSTNQNLNRGRDYKFTDLDLVASKRSGSEVYRTIVLTNKQLSKVRLTYMFVGGEHLSGEHLIDAMKKIYPNGIETIFPWDNVTNKPEAWKAKPHLMHMKDTYGYDAVDYSANRIYDSLQRGKEVNIKASLQIVAEKIKEVKTKTNETIDGVKSELDQAFNEQKVQEGEYIFTDNRNNPNNWYGYGNWTNEDTNGLFMGRNKGPIAGNFLNGYGASLVGDGGQHIRGVMVWKYVGGGGFNSLQLALSKAGSVNSTTFRENEEVVIDIKPLGLTIGTKVQYSIIDMETNDLVEAKYIDGTNNGYITVLGLTSPVKLKFKPITGAKSPVRQYKLKTLYPNAELIFNIAGQTASRYKTAYFSLDVDGLIPLKELIEGQDFYLQVNTVGYNQGEIIYIDDSLSGTNIGDFEINYPRFVTVTSGGKLSFLARVRADRVTDGVKYLILHLKDSFDAEITNVTPRAEVKVLDTSQFNVARITFLRNNNPSSFINEGENFKIRIETDLPLTRMNLIYDSTRALTEFTGLVTSCVTSDKVNSNGYYFFEMNAFLKKDFHTNNILEAITLTAEELTYGIIGVNTVVIKDTSITPIYKYSFKNAGGVVINEIGEGNRILFEITVDNWDQTQGEPELDLRYILDEFEGTAKINERITAPLHRRLPFGPSSDVLDKVNWVRGNTLQLEFDILQDGMATGDVFFDIFVKPRQDASHTATPQGRLIVLDTSVPEVKVEFSLSALTLNPLLSLKEMNTDGTNYICYMWVEMLGDGTKLGDVSIFCDKPSELVGFGIQKVKFTTLNRRHIIPVTINADFAEEGNELLTFKGTYGNGRNLFSREILLEDNSVKHPVTLNTSTSASTVIAPTDGMFSELAPIYVHVQFPAYNFTSNLKSEVYVKEGNNWIIAKTDDISNPNPTVNMAVNTQVGVLQINPIADRVTDGDKTYKIIVRRYRDSDNTLISIVNEIQFTIKDDSRKAEVKMEFFSNPERTVALNPLTVNEGQMVYGNLLVTDTMLVGGRKMVTYVGRNSTVWKPEATFNKVLSIHEDVLGTVKVPFEMYMPVDRTTTGNRNFTITGYLSLMDNPTVGAAATTSNTTTFETVTAIFTVLDTSKTPSYSYEAPSAVQENDVQFSVSINIKDGTAGDVYYIALDGAFDTTRLSQNQLGVEQLLVVNDSKITWNFRVKPNYKTDGDTTLSLNFINKSAGTNVGNVKINVLDTSKTPVLTIVALKSIGGMLRTVASIDENSDPSAQFFLAVYGDNMPANEKLRLTMDGNRRPISDVTLSGKEFNTYYTAEPINIDGVNRSGVYYPVVIKADKKTNTTNELGLPLNAYSQTSGAALTGSVINIRDTSKPRNLDSYRWEIGGTVVNSVNEGQTVTLVINTSGGEDKFIVELENQSPRPASGFGPTDFGALKTQGEARYNITVAADGITNTNDHLFIQARVVMDRADSANSKAVTIPPFPIIDVSKNTQASIVYYAPGSTSTNIGIVDEGKSTDIAYTLTGMVKDWNYTAEVFILNNGAETVLRTETYSHSSPESFVGYTFRMLGVVVPADSISNPNTRFLNTRVKDKDGKIIGAGSIIIRDVSRTPLTPGVDIWISETGNKNNKIDQVYEGTGFLLNFSAKCFQYVDWDSANPSFGIFAAASGNNSSYLATIPDIGRRFSINKGQLAADGTFSINWATKTDLATTNPDKQIYGKFFEYDLERGNSNIIAVKDVSTVPYLSRLRFCSDPDGINELAWDLNVNTMGTFYIALDAYYMTTDKSPIVVNLSHTANSYFNKLGKLPSTLTLVNKPEINEWFYRGVVACNFN